MTSQVQGKGSLGVGGGDGEGTRLAEPLSPKSRF